MKRVVALLLLAVGSAPGQPAGDAVATLNEKIVAGELALRFDDAHGYLRAVLDALHVPVESQMLVFSKTSSQAMNIEPRNPRALYFNDAVTVGWVRGGLLEVMAQSPGGNISFYTVDQRPWVHRERIAKTGALEKLFVARQDCVHCHGNTDAHIPGPLLTSVSPTSDGVPIARLGLQPTDHRTPFEKLWGGWYVTGSMPGLSHMGNAVVRGTADKLEPLNGAFDTAAYPSPHSDVVALMVFEHQMHMMQLLAASHVNDNTRELVDYMLFVDEPALRGKVAGASGFAEKFTAQGPKDKHGRSLREFDLNTRLLRYPCSYMIYSAAFDGLPAQRKAAIYRRLWQVLSGEETGTRYQALKREDRRAIVEILTDTLPGLPSYFSRAAL